MKRCIALALCRPLILILLSGCLAWPQEHRNKASLVPFNIRTASHACFEEIEGEGSTVEHLVVEVADIKFGSRWVPIPFGRVRGVRGT